MSIEITNVQAVPDTLQEQSDFSVPEALVAEIDELKVNPAGAKDVGDGGGSGQSRDLVERRIGLRRVADADAAAALERRRHILGDGAHHAPVGDGVDPAFGVARVLFAHEVRLEEDRLARRDPAAERVPGGRDDARDVEAGEAEAVANA